MIEELRITDLGVIKEATLEPHPALTVVTGETGAGKTMIVTGIGLLLGARADARAVRSGADRTRVEGRFVVDLPSLLARVREAGGQLDDNDLLVARHVTSAGRSRSYLGGAQMPAGVCAGITAELVTIHGQSEQHRLADRDRQRDLLDRYAGEDHSTVLRDHRTRYAERQSARAELDRLTAEAQERAREIELLRFGLDEIARVDPQPGEDVALAAEAHRLQSIGDLQSDGRVAIEALAGTDEEAGGALAGIALARAAADRLAAQDPDTAPLAGRVAEIGYLLSELTGDLAGYLSDLEAQPERLEQIAERRFALNGLTRRYGETCDDVLEWARRSAERLLALESADDRITELSERLGALEAELGALAERIHHGRRRAADAFATRVAPELAALAMPHATLAFELVPTELGPYGADQVDLLFSANPGSEPRSLGRVASGGELSRVRLALEVTLATGREPGTFVFDEVDAGVGGTVAVEVGRRLAALARHAQVVVVTHLAQVAAFADRHFVVAKSDAGQVTTSDVRQVADSERAAELARMMAGMETSDSALAHAGELLALASAR